MKVFAVLLAFFSLSTACALSDAEVSLDSTVYHSSQPPSVETRFAADKDLGRAWILLTVKDRIAAENNGAPPETVKVRVDGLSFDPATGDIVYEANQHKTVCATQRRIFVKQFYKQTRDCQISVSFDTRKIDDGFNLREERIANIVLDVARR